MSHIYVSELCPHWFRQWLVAYSAPSHYLNQCWPFVHWTPVKQISVKFDSALSTSPSRKCIWTCCLPKWRPFCLGRDELTTVLINHLWFRWVFTSYIQLWIDVLNFSNRKWIHAVDLNNTQLLSPFYRSLHRQSQFGHRIITHVSHHTIAFILLY